MKEQFKENMAQPSVEQYHHLLIEQKWRNRWEETGIYRSEYISGKEKKYVLDMFPYPSAKGIHLGHVEGYSMSDILVRYYRMNGFSVLHPMGWDSFGLPTENYALRMRTTPQDVTKENVDNFRKQCKRLGFGYDWTRELDTSSPEYYKWAQWLFLKLYEKGVAYRAEAPVNWCPNCQTVLADDQLVNEQCERCGSDVTSKVLKQWFFRITNYADQLLEGLTYIDWPESTKEGQRNWIGRNKGFDIDFKLLKGNVLTAFTTRPETLFGATFLVIAPENPNAEECVIEKQKEAVIEYLKEIKLQGREKIRNSSKSKRGVFTGSFATNPANNDKVPIWISDYVAMDYGTGIIMGVPAHDERDQAFALENGLNSVEVIDNEEKLVNSGRYNGLDTNAAKIAITRDLGEKARSVIRYKMRDWLISRQRYWGTPIPIVYCEECGEVPVPEDQMPILLPTDIDDYRPKGRSPLEQSKSFYNTNCPKCGKIAQRETDTMDTFVSSAFYFLRFCDPKSKEYLAKKEDLSHWMPIDVYIGGAEHTVGHLIHARFITKFLKEIGVVPVDEPFLKLRHPGIILGPDGRKMSKRFGNIVNPDNVVDEVGADSLRVDAVFLGPMNETKVWSTNSAKGARRFLERVWELQYKIMSETNPTEEEVLETNTLIKKVSSDIETLKLNTAVAKLMTFVNFAEKSGISAWAWEKFLLVLAPFAPHITEELWEKAGKSFSVHTQEWPTYNEASIKKDNILVIQVNGKKIGTIIVPTEITEEELIELIMADEKWRARLAGKEIKRTIWAKGKVINFVV